MKILSSLLLAGLAVVVSAAPAAPRVLADERRAPEIAETSDPTGENKAPGEKSGPTDTKDASQPAGSRHVVRGPVLAAPGRLSTSAERSTANATTPTVEDAPALRARHLPTPPVYAPPVPDASAEPRAGLRDLPPPCV